MMLEGARVLRSGPVTVLRGRYADEEVVVKRLAPTAPWTDRGSAFFGGDGIAPPFVPLLLHEAEAWRRVDPDRVVLSEVTDEATWLVLRHQPGAPPSAEDDPEALLVGLLRALAALHAADVLHRDVRPGNVLVHEGRVALIDLDVARVAGLGPVGLVGSRRFRAPETWVGEGDDRADLYAAAATIRAVCGVAMSAQVAELVGACLAESAGDRPRSAREALRALGEDAPEPSLSPAHPWARAWWSDVWTNPCLLAGEPWEVVRHVDRGGVEASGMAAAASRLLAAAPQLGREAWLALGAVCWSLHVATGSPRYAAQADEARVYADAAWHPAARGLDLLLSRAGRAADRTSALCAVGLPTLALQEAVAARDASRTARAAWELGDAARVDAALRAARGDALAVAVAASRALLDAPDRAEEELVRLALRADVLEAVRRMLHAGNVAGAEVLARALPGPPEARVLVHVAAGQLEPARETACACAAAGVWSVSIAALVASYPDAPEEARRRAMAILRQSLPPPIADADAMDALAALGQRPGAPERWVSVLVALAGVSRQALAGTLVGLAADTAGPAPWRLLIGVLCVDAPQRVVAEAVYQRALALFPDDPDLLALGAALALLRADRVLAESRIALCIACAPHSPWGWLLRAATASDAKRALRALTAAEAFGAPAELVGLIRAPLHSRVDGAQ